jgi:AI-2 transport protein TqsA
MGNASGSCFGSGDGVESQPVSYMKGIRFAVGLATVFLLFYILKLGQDLLIPFVYALFVWYLVNILAYAFRTIRYHNLKIPTWLSFVLSVGTIFGVGSIVFKILSSNISNIASGSLVYREKVNVIVSRLFNLAGIAEPESLTTLLSDLDLSGMMSDIASALASIGGSTFFILVYLMFLFLEQKSFSNKLKALARGPEREQEILRIIRKIQSDVRLYLGIKTFTSALTGILSYFVMASINLEFASFWALLIFLLNYIPSIGSILATVFPSLLALMQFELQAPFWIVCIGVSLLQFFIGNFLEPRLMGNSLNLSPLVILFSLTFWGTLWGIPGAFLCVPIMVVFMIVLSHFPTTQPIAIMMSRDGNVTKS